MHFNIFELTKIVPAMPRDKKEFKCHSSFSLLGINRSTSEGLKSEFNSKSDSTSNRAFWLWNSYSPLSID
jgi:hypothetical protein